MNHYLQTIRETYPEISLTVVYGTNKAFVEFYAYEIVGHVQDNDKKFDVPIYERLGSKGSGDETEDVKEAQTLIKGLVKWDGCSHLTFGDKDGYIHACGRRNIKNLTAAIEKIYFRCGELMPGHFDPTEFTK